MNWCRTKAQGCSARVSYYPSSPCTTSWHYRRLHTLCKAQCTSLPCVCSRVFPPSLVLFNKQFHSRKNKDMEVVSIGERTLLRIVATEEVTDGIIAARHILRQAHETVARSRHLEKCSMQMTCRSRWWAP